MTQEDLRTIYERAKQYIIAKYNIEPIAIEIEEDGTMSAEYLESRGCCGDPDEYSHHYFSVEDLTSDLDELVLERKRKEAIETERRKAYEEEQRKERGRRDKEARKQRFLELKKEFES